MQKKNFYFFSIDIINLMKYFFKYIKICNKITIMIIHSQIPRNINKIIRSQCID